MKNIFLFLAVSAAFVFTSCEGPEGPPGEPGGLVYGQVFETTENLQYDSASATYTSPFISFPVEVFESDVILAYRYEGSEVVNGTSVDIWNPLPRSYFYQDGTSDIFEYSFNHTFFDIQFVIDGNFDLTIIEPEFTTNQTFRIAVVPAEFATANLTMDDLMQGLQIDATDIEQISK
ncbi:hypothetical protein [Ulvibacter litoralis]|uniref:Dihydrolipoamide dehydrogenase n=1 Tax=Ulvibacter litoralis TaxID=227084 RepID=A0A1G7FUP6_9FLAO|nr:hypothetical protein [Ulvibacter litoralis]GHC63933.1 hypothetical protein GCM10008083_31480 [Ulvibacter litoralis]SDE79588.1 hypothetical protein SAMN05421855_102789 [Ulvibacter litoralis]